MESENFKPIYNNEDYAVSNLGNVKQISTDKALKPYKLKTGYITVYINNAPFPVHRLVAWAFIPNPEHKRCVDHIDGNRENNDVLNLRWATHEQNAFNRKIRVDNKTGNTGVYFNNKCNKWYSCISINGKLTNLGYFDTKEEAIKIRVISANEIYGEFCNSRERLTPEITELDADLLEM